MDYAVKEVGELAHTERLDRQGVFGGFYRHKIIDVTLENDPGSAAEC